MNKYKLSYLDSSKQNFYFTKNDKFCINLNAFIKKNIEEKNVAALLQTISLPHEINLCNLSSLCFRLNINYNSIECLQLVDSIVKLLRDNRDDVIFTQNNIQNYFEVDMQPINFNLIVDDKNSIIYINKILKDTLCDLGYTDCQLVELLTTVKKITKIIPRDKLTNTIYDMETHKVYKMIKEILH